MIIKSQRTRETLTAQGGAQKIHTIYLVMLTEVNLTLFRHPRKIMLRRALELVQKLLPIRLHNRVYICRSMHSSDSLDVCL